ncbi:MAG: hypothetical protein KAI99_18705, partial [Cyclobacteriaceae bacterium]|nr:hypothetical protein [Cyclobacteriaceae bacterium]
MKTKSINLNQKNFTTVSPFWMFLGIITCLLLFSNQIIAQDEDKNEKQWEDFGPNNFDDNSINITNDWMPLKPGMRYVYAGTTLDDDDNLIPHRVLIHVTDL